MKKILLLLLVSLSICTVKADDYSDAFKVYKEYLGAMITKNLGKVMNCLDKTSPNYKSEIKAAAESMLNTDMSFKIKSAILVGETGDFIVLRVVQQNLPQTTNPDIKGVEIDALQILRKDENGEWLYRSSQILAIRQLSS